MKINNLTTYPNLIDATITNSDKWTTVSNIETYNSSVLGTVSKFKFTTTDTLSGTYKQSITLDPSKNYTISLILQGSELIDTDSRVDIVYNDARGNEQTLVTFGTLFNCSLPFIFNFTGVSRMDNLHLKCKTTHTIYAYNLQLQLGTLDSEYVLEAADKQAVQDSWNNITKSLNSLVTNNTNLQTGISLDTINSLIDSVHPLYSAYSDDTVVSSGVIPYTYAYTGNSALSTLVCDINLGVLNDGASHTLFYGNNMLLLGNSMSSNDSANVFKETNNNNLASSFFSTSDWGSSQHSSTFNDIYNINTISYQGSSGWEHLRASVPFVASGNNQEYTWFFTLGFSTGISYLSGWDYIPVSFDSVTGSDTSKVVLKINKDTQCISKPLDLSIITDRITNQITEVSNTIYEANLSKQWTNIQKVYNNLITYVPSALSYPSITNDYNTLQEKVSAFTSFDYNQYNTLLTYISNFEVNLELVRNRCSMYYILQEAINKGQVATLSITVDTDTTKTLKVTYQYYQSNSASIISALDDLTHKIAMTIEIETGVAQTVIQELYYRNGNIVSI